MVHPIRREVAMKPLPILGDGRGFRVSEEAPRGPGGGQGRGGGRRAERVTQPRSLGDGRRGGVGNRGLDMSCEENPGACMA